ncbi:hypothetical protein COCVIDRAFT_85939 [Bipolaris victoriae FI3]|uniref:Uncharacterized protein n=1 Tax=Bipolaris victoriae (strain FI3) TaxID=930091 RepID=W7EYN5_BIPV3|nr:hypothetical protein COCVIDRAFT_85939 [Bipolaris victoriae FI3]
MKKIRESQVIIQTTIDQRAKLICYAALVYHNLQHLTQPPPLAETLTVNTTFAGDHSIKVISWAITIFIEVYLCVIKENSILRK